MSWIDIEGWEDRNDAEGFANQRIAAQAASYVDGDDSGDEGDGSAFGTMGDPIAIGIRSYNLAMRREDAALITVEQIG